MLFESRGSSEVIRPFSARDLSHSTEAGIDIIIIIIIYEHLYRIKTFSTSYKIIKNTAINGGPVLQKDI